MEYSYCPTCVGKSFHVIGNLYLECMHCKRLLQIDFFRGEDHEMEKPEDPGWLADVAEYQLADR